VVVGGGLAGVCSALSAARHGAKTILIQDRPMLGGNTSSEIRVHAGGADCSGSRPHARESGIMEEIRLEEAARNPQRCAQIWDLILYEKCLDEENLDLHLNTTATAVSVENGRIVSIQADCHHAEQRFNIEGEFFIDCTGDGRLAAEAGAEYRMGREGPEEFDELHAKGPDKKTMGASLMWLAEDVGVPVPFEPPRFARTFDSDEELPHRGHSNFEHGYWWIEYGGELDTVRDKEEIRDELMACMMGVWDHIKNGGDHGADNWVLKWFGWLPGHRESRRIMGDYVLRERDLMEGVRFDDRVAHGGWSMDRHPPGGIFSDEPPADFLQVPDIYSIPLRSLYARELSNLFMAGRCASCTHMAMSSTRLAATGAAMGQAAGTAAAMCCRRKCTPKELAENDIGDLQQQLLKNDQYIIDLPADDPDDLAGNASISASSERDGCAAVKVTDGVTRFRKGDTHEWVSDPEQSLPQWLELTLPGARTIREIHLTFNSGFQRPLTFTLSDTYNAKMVRGPQPETVADYVIEAGTEGVLQEIVRETGNYQRKIVHEIKATQSDTVRITINRTNGDASARIFEVRLYE
ncbi:MAG: FAD-dependent oxidoreductase, partial [Armatimonadota bacterium]